MEHFSNRPIEVFLRPTYLLQGLTADERLRCHTHNFLALTRRLDPLSVAAMFDVGLKAFSRTVDAVRYDILFFQPKIYRNQGELCLSLLRDDVELFTLGLAFVPGDIFGLEDETAILISRMQGMRNFQDIRAATRDLGDVSPQALLFCALRGVATALNIPKILGPCARLQVSFHQQRAAEFGQAYDEFFATLEATRDARGLYVMDSALPEDVLANLPAKHRARTKAKRKFKAAVSQEALELFAAYRRPVEPAFEIVLCAPHLATRVGVRSGAVIATTGAEGVVACGPYPPLGLARGAYEAQFLAEVDGGDFPAEIADDVSGDILARGEWRDLAGEVRPGLGFEVVQEHSVIEFRVTTPATTSLRLRGVRVVRRAD